eukprot:TRINITY_DN2683_c0_g1_i1.p1 TRINITY_DN2683_c0_g1~~TRINITY_DN2683_c0_g1_i1.p1  ORF type:complete len:566 (-),score=90.30 TRINITY_DN2683_c0_g1_i1:85-1782(-)
MRPGESHQLKTSICSPPLSAMWPALLLSALPIHFLEAAAAENSTGCAEISDLKTCAEASCFPHYVDMPPFHICVDAERVSCKLSEGKATNTLALLVSDGLSNKDLKHAFRQVVLELPSEAWDGGGGDSQKQEALGRDVAGLAAVNFNEPALYKGLTALLISDACYLKRFEKDPWPCESFKSTLLDLGFEATKISEVYLFEVILANLGPKEAETYANIQGDLRQLLDPSSTDDNVTEIEGLKSYVAQQGAWQPLVDLFESVDVIGVSGGSPDFLKFAMSLSPYVKEHITTAVGEGRIVYTARSAGAMVGSVDSALTTEMKPRLWEHLGITRHGLGLVGSCAIRPHYNADTWDKASEMYENTLDINVVRMPNGEGLMCKGKDCKMVGMAHNVKWSSDKHAPPTITVDEENTIPHQEGHTAYPSGKSYTISDDDELGENLKASLPENPSFGSENPKCRLCLLQVVTGSVTRNEKWIASGCDVACADADTAVSGKHFLVSDGLRASNDFPGSNWMSLTLAACGLAALCAVGILCSQHSKTSRRYGCLGDDAEQESRARESESGDSSPSE